MKYFIAIGFWIFVICLIRKDTARRDGVSAALWIPTFWVGILLSRPLTMWLGFGGGTDSLEGSPLDRLFYFGLIFLALVILSKRGIDWPMLISKNWPIFLFYGYLLVTVLWADSSVVSFKRWFKDFGNIFVVLIILTEQNPQQAIRAVFVRCAYFLLPLSVIFIRYFPNMGRFYSNEGGLEITGVSTQKNSLGILVLVCGLVLLWDCLERTGSDRAQMNWVERYLPFGFFLIGSYLLKQCHSATSILCLVLGGTIMLSSRLPFLRDRVKSMGGLTLAGFAGFFLLDWIFGIKEAIVGGMGRNMTFTGRTNVWHELLALKTDPIIGTGFCSFWSNQFYRSRLPDWVAHSAHNGYLETYIDGGIIGLFFLGIMLLSVAFGTNRQIRLNGNCGLLRHSTLLSLLIGDLSESHFGRMSALFFLFLVTALELPRRNAGLVSAETLDYVAGRTPVEAAPSVSWLATV